VGTHMEQQKLKFVRTLLFTSLALTAFAANSILSRLALNGAAIDAPGFTVIRLLSGALTMSLVLLVTRSFKSPNKGSWLCPLSQRWGGFCLQVRLFP
jgi:hypothetical protein